MKNVLKIGMVLALCAATFTSCETYGDPDIEYTAVAPLDGRWICMMYDYNEFKAQGENAVPREFVEVWASNTSENVADKMWHNMVFPLAPAAWEVGGESILPYVDILSIKVDSDPGNLTFGVTNAVGTTPPPNVASPLYYNGVMGPVPTRLTVMTGWEATITEAQVKQNGFTGTSGTIADKISYAIELDHAIRGVSKFMVVGHRYTMWAEDYLYIDEFVDNYDIE
jgi:hypothetical protein